MNRQYGRRSIRLKEYDYSLPDAYFITICTHQRKCILGEVIDGDIQLSPCGKIVQACWYGLPHRFPFVELDEFVIMPNHIHGIVLITGRGEAMATTPTETVQCQTANASPLQHTPRGTVPGSLGAIIQTFKSVSSRRINRITGTKGNTVWQRNYYEHIIRSEKSWDAIQEYITANPAQWVYDNDNPLNFFAVQPYIQI